MKDETTLIYSTMQKCIKGETMTAREATGLLKRVKGSTELRTSLEECSPEFAKGRTPEEQLYCYIHDVTDEPICPYCGKPRPFNGRMSFGYYHTCGSDACKNEGMKKGSLNRTEESYRLASLKGKGTYFKKTGYYNNMQNPEGFAYWKKSFNEKHGVDHPMQLHENVEKSQKNIMERYGTTDLLHCEKSTETIIEKYGSVENMHKILADGREKSLHERRERELDEKIKELGFKKISYENDTLTLKCKKCGQMMTVTRAGLNYYYRNGIRFCSKCDYKNMTFRSNGERQVSDFIKSVYSGEIEYNRYVGGVECDIIIPDKHIAIEYNGLYWHSELYKENNHHQEKKKKVAAVGYNLINIWEDDWNDVVKSEIIKSRLCSKLGLNKTVYARKCNIVKYSGKDVKKIIRPFLDNNHIQGFIKGIWYYGLEYEGELVQMIIIGKTRSMISGKSSSFELLRMCSLKGLNVVGGFSKLIKCIVKDENIDRLVSYVDLDWSDLNNTSYESIGFRRIKITEPNYWWEKDGIKYNRLRFTKQNLVREGYDASKSETEIMYERGYKKIYGTGNLVMDYVEGNEMKSKGYKELSFDEMFSEQIENGLKLDVQTKDIVKEFDYFKSVDGYIEAQPRNNKIIYKFQQSNFFKKENDIFQHNEELRTKLIKNRVKYLNKPASALTDAELLRGFKISGIHISYSHFSPFWTKYIAQTFGFKSVADPFGGWGHHMLGFAAAGCDYVYNDLSHSTVEGVRKMNEFFDFNFRINEGDAATFKIPDDCDSVFMCPPYYNTEIYECGEFESKEDFDNLIYKVFDNYLESNATKLAVIIREDMEYLFEHYGKLGNYKIKELVNGKGTHLYKSKYNCEYLYIFDKEQ